MTLTDTPGHKSGDEDGANKDCRLKIGQTVSNQANQCVPH